MTEQSTADDTQSLLQFVYQFPVAVLRMNGEGTIDLINPRAAALLMALGVQFQPHQGWSILEAFDPALAEMVRDHLTSPGLVAEQRPVERRDPRGHAYHLVVTALMVEAGSCMIAIEDVTKRVLQERQLQHERQNLAVVLEALQGYFVLLLYLKLRITAPNRSVERLLGPDAAVAGRAVSDLLKADSLQPVDLEVQAELAIRDGWASFEAEYSSADGGSIWGDTLLTPIVDEAGAPSSFVVVARDVSERRRREAALIDDALTDPLTGLLNRRGLIARAAPLVDEARLGRPLTLAVLAFDIDFFKKVNDSHGHDGGDEVLRHFGQLLKQQFRRDDLVARRGGEEFVVLLRDVPVDVVMSLGERARQLVENTPAPGKGGEIAITTSVGVAFSAEVIDLEELLKEADVALYRAKAEGRNRVVRA